MIKLFLAVLLAAFPLAAAAQSPPTRFTVTVEGSGPDVIMIPGLTSSRRVWDQAVRATEGRYRVHRLQIAGFGGEPAGANAEGPILENVVAELHDYIAANCLDRPKVVGHSVGGLLALMLAARHPDDVGEMLLVDALPFYGMLFGPDATVANVEPQAAALRDAILAMDDSAWSAQQPAGIAALVSNEAARPAVIEDSLASDRAVVARALYEDMVADMRPALPAIRTPLTIAYALNPFATEDRFGRLFRTGYAEASQVRFIAVEPSYHFVMLDQPDRFAEILLEFLQAR
jgi:pimeloyl-ACP methyl ester carboxylesterase